MPELLGVCRCTPRLPEASQSAHHGNAWRPSQARTAVAFAKMVLPERIRRAASYSDLTALKSWFKPDSGRDVNDQELAGWTCLMCAIFGPNGDLQHERSFPAIESCVKWLLSIGANANLLTVGGFGALHVACSTPSSTVALVRMLLDAGAAINVMDRVKIGTPFGRALNSHLSIDVLRLLLRRGASLDSVVDYEAEGNWERRQLSAEDVLNEQLDSHLKYLNEPVIRDQLDFVIAVRAAGSYKKYVRLPHTRLLRLRSLVARGRAAARLVTQHAIVRLLSPKTPNEVVWTILAYWRET